MTAGGPSNSGSFPEFPRRPADAQADAQANSQAGRIPDELVDAFFDRELDPQRSRDILANLKNDPARSEEIARTQRMVSLLRRTLLHAERAEDDRVDAIMARVDRRRSFLPPAWRRLVTAGRLAAAASVLLAGLGVAVAGRVRPDLFRLAPQQAPIATLVESGRSEAASGAAQCRVTLETISDRAAAPIYQLRAEIVSARGCVPLADAPAAPLRAGMIAAVRFSDSDSDVLIARGSGEPVAGSMGASFALGLEFISVRQRSDASAASFAHAMGPGRGSRSAEAGIAPGAGKATSAVFTAVGAPGAFRSIRVGDHTVVLPAAFDAGGGIGGPDAARRLLLIQAVSSDLFPPR